MRSSRKPIQKKMKIKTGSNIIFETCKPMNLRNKNSIAKISIMIVKYLKGLTSFLVKMSHTEFIKAC